MTLNDLLASAVSRLRAAGMADSREEAEILFAGLLQWDRARLIRDLHSPVSSDDQRRLQTMWERRAQGEPTAYILGYRDFYKYRFQVQFGVLVPRPETELIVEEALKTIDKDALLQIADLGCGSGCLGLSILMERAKIRLTGFDISPVAVEVSRSNARQLKLVERARFELMSADEGLANRKPQMGWDMVVMNPPYIDVNDSRVAEDVRRFEPHEALFSPDQGLSHIRSWSEAARKTLKPKGRIFCEIGCDQAPSVVEYWKSLGFKKIQAVRDLAGHQRMIHALQA